MTSRSSIQKFPKALAQDELEALRSVRMNPRDRALIAVLSRCGLRVSEACSLTVDNIHWSTGTPSLRFTGKRNKERVVPMNLEVQDVLREWLDSRHFSDSPSDQIILFGSQAYGEPKTDSDLDLLVIMDTDLRPTARSAAVARICRPKYVAMDIVVRTPEEIQTHLQNFDPFLEEIFKLGRTLYKSAG